MENYRKYGFEDNFKYAKEARETIERFLKELKRDEVKETVSIANPKKINDVIKVYNLAMYFAKNKDTEVVCEMHTPVSSMGSVSIIGKNLTFDNSEWMNKAINTCDVFNVYAREDGKVRIDFAFNDLTQRIS